MELLIEIMEATPAFSSENFIIKSHIRRTCADSQSITRYDSKESIILIIPNSDPSNSNGMLQLFN